MDGPVVFGLPLSATVTERSEEKPTVSWTKTASNSARNSRFAVLTKDHEV